MGTQTAGSRPSCNHWVNRLHCRIHGSQYLHLYREMRQRAGGSRTDKEDVAFRCQLAPHRSTPIAQGHELIVPVADG